MYCTALYHTVPSLADTHLLIKLFMLGPLDKSLVVGGGIAIIATSSRSRSDFEIDFEIETNLEIEI